MDLRLKNIFNSTPLRPADGADGQHPVTVMMSNFLPRVTRNLTGVHFNLFSQ